MKRYAKKRKPSPEISKNSRFSSPLALIFIVITVIVGVLVLASSFAAGGEVPEIKVFTADPSTLNKAGETSTLHWSAFDALYCTLSGPNITDTTNDISSFALVAPQKTSTYTLKCVGTCPSKSKCIVAPSDIETLKVTVKTAVPPTPSPQPNPSPVPPPTPPNPVAPPPAAPAVVKSKSGDAKAPSKPKNFTALLINASDAVDLSWRKATDNVGVVGYSLERSIDQTEWTYLDKNISSSTTVYRDSPVSAGDTYYYRLRAKDKAGNESEAVFTYAVIENNGIDDGEATPVPVVAPTEKDGGSAALGITLGSLLLLGSAVAGTLWWKKRNDIGSASYDEQIREQSVESAIDTTSQEAPHASQSLKDMVMDDYDPDKPKNKHSS